MILRAIPFGDLKAPSVNSLVTVPVKSETKMEPSSDTAMFFGSENNPVVLNCVIVVPSLAISKRN